MGNNDLSLNMGLDELPGMNSTGLDINIGGESRGVCIAETQAGLWVGRLYVSPLMDAAGSVFSRAESATTDLIDPVEAHVSLSSVDTRARVTHWLAGLEGLPYGATPPILKVKYGRYGRHYFLLKSGGRHMAYAPAVPDHISDGDRVHWRALPMLVGIPDDRVQLWVALAVIARHMGRKRNRDSSALKGRSCGPSMPPRTE